MGQPRSGFLSAFGIAFQVFKALVDEVLNLGGDDDDLRRIETDANLRRQLAELIVKGTGGVIRSFRDQIWFGGYDYTYDYADRPEEIKGQVFHPVTGETELDHPGEQLTTKQVYERYSGRMASLSELLDYGIKNPETQRQFPIGIVWKDDDGRFWCALLCGSSGRRELGVGQDHPGDLWRDYGRFLVRKLED